MSEETANSPYAAPPDSALPGWLSRLPVGLAPYASLARMDRPVGVWLLFLPCLIGLTFSRLSSSLQPIDMAWIGLFLIGAFAMRSAGCVWNDIRDRNLDAQVARTASRPLPAGQITVQQAYLFLLALLTIGFLVWLCLPLDAKLIALGALPLVALYPLMKRVTWWPQAWLGMTFNWGVLVASATIGTVTLPTLILYLGLIFWTIAYDTIYALQDREDDALIGVKSTARLFGAHVKAIAFLFHALAASLIAFATILSGYETVGAIAALLFLVHGAWQSLRLKAEQERNALAIFKSNVWAGGMIACAFGTASFF